MTPFREILSNYRSENFGSVSLANEKICDVHGLGDACLIFDNGFKLILKNVRYVPDLAHNLISCSALEEEGLEGKWGKGIMKIMKGSLTMFKAERKRNLYICTVKYDCFAASVLNTNKTDLWHKRLGHISSKDPHSSLLGKLPECVWTGKNVDLSYLRIFGCSAFVFQNSDKLEPRALKCVFIGYPEGIKGYRLWLRCQPGFKVVISKDVTFNESEMPCLENSSKRDLDFQLEGTEKGANLGSLLDSEKWIKAMNEEIKALHDNNTWTLVPKPKDASVVDCKWIFKIKQENNTSRFKARLVAKGFTQNEAAHFQLSKEQSPKTELETEHMKSVPYSNAIGSVMYLMVSTRPNIAYAVSCLSRYMSNAGLPHWEALKWLLRFLLSGPRRFLPMMMVVFDTCGFGPRWKLLKTVAQNHLGPPVTIGRQFHFGPFHERWTVMNETLTSNPQDGTHLYTKYKYEMLIAVVMDENQQMVSKHIVRGVSGICLISDRHPGLMGAIDDIPDFVPPRDVHRLCLSDAILTLSKLPHGSVHVANGVNLDSFALMLKRIQYLNRTPLKHALSSQQQRQHAADLRASNSTVFNLFMV
ncbi:Retrovirus-related Pol polyprotein from transposon TNT 1-94 [Sesamum angolense]|uniref:Retrovirus-related Pol polyprotein from transposon TNT 1-94 n=1 Tax=Sesamum angolense TaxID=2727404 RepID=A0AAE1T6L0_9LAMI|nr:Retrovirus-related Pol polyprotein from transposon TNT 1-94 [Sesamum angolense]